jgi:hypothetical protein
MMSKIDLITDALEIWQKMCLDNGRASSELGIATKAFAAARELQALKPTAYLDEEMQCAYSIDEMDDGEDYGFIPLYALEVTK